jgi:integrase
MAQLLLVSVADWNPNTQTLRLTDPKGRRTTAREHLLPLAPKGVAIVSELVRRAALLKTEWLFSSTGKVAMTFETPGKRCAEISTGIGGASFDLRDIRRTVETMLAGMGISKDVRAQLLSHGISGVQSANYDRHDYVIEKRAALVAWENHLTRLSATKRTPRTSKRGTANRQPIAKPTA